MTQSSMCLPTLSASAQTKRYLTERKRERKHQDTKHYSPGATHLLYLTCARTHAGMFDFTIFPSFIISGSFNYAVSNSQRPHYSEAWMTCNVQLNFLQMIGAPATRVSCRDDILHSNTCCKPQEYPLLHAACHYFQYLVFLDCNTDCKTQITLTSKADHRTQDRGREAYMHNVATGILNM